jgi:hypothetical protein
MVLGDRAVKAARVTLPLGSKTADALPTSRTMATPRVAEIAQGLFQEPIEVLAGKRAAETAAQRIMREARDVWERNTFLLPALQAAWVWPPHIMVPGREDRVDRAAGYGKHVVVNGIRYDVEPAGRSGVSARMDNTSISLTNRPGWRSSRDCRERAKR